MRITVLVVDETTETWPAKNGKPAGEAKQLTCLDMDPHPGERFSSTFDYRLAESEVQFFGSMRDKKVQIAIREFENGFGGRLKCRGHLVVASLGAAALPESATVAPNKYLLHIMESPDVYVLSQVTWDFFVTLTFGCEDRVLLKVPERVRYAMLFRWLREVAEQGKVHFPSLLFAVRDENGETGGRPHFHALLGNTEQRPSQRSCHRIRHAWSSQEGIAGMARCTVFDPLRDAGSYLTKPETWASDTTTGGLRIAAHARTGGDVYESRKFGSDVVEKLTISQSVYRYIAAKRAAALA